MVWRLVLLFAALAAAQYPTPTKYDFTLLGCYKDDANRDLPTLGYSSTSNPTEISTSFGVSLSFCAPVCQILNFRYAGAQAGGECWCGNSYGSKGEATNCDTACSGDSSEKCGGPWANTVMDLSTVAGTICPPGYPESGALCCPERASFKLIDQALLNFLNELFPEKDFRVNPNGGLTQAQLAQRQAYLSSSVSPNFFFVTEGNFTITILADGAGNRNQVGYFLINQNGAILNTYQDIFGEASLTSKKGPGKFSWKRCVEVGLSATRGPFPPGTGIGFFVHSDGANSKTLSDSCRNKQSIRDCLRQKGPRDYTCYSNENGCSIGASNTPLHGLNTFSSIDSLNEDGFRHVAIIDTQYGLILGFEDLWNIGDKDYNDVMFLISTTGEVTGNFPKLCDPACNSINGKCDYSTGTCQCDSAPGVTLDAQCNCQGACTGCTSGGTCRCSDKTCICKAGFESSPNGNDCACSRDPGRCTGVPGSFSCGQCNCNAGYGSPVANGLIGGIYNIKFGTSQVSVAANYFLDYGVSRNIVDSSDFGLYGWDTDHTGQALRYNGDEINGSTMKLKQNAVWSMRLQPNTNYDVTVTFGSQQGSSHSLNVNSNKLIENKQLGVNEYMSYTTRVNTGASGLIQLREPNKGADLTRITSVTIAIPPCSCVACSGGCGPGVCDCYTGNCKCPTGFSGGSCQNCASGFWGPDCKPCTCVHGTCSQGKSGTGTCTCATGWTGANCDTCAAGFWGNNCAPCPSCVPGQGSCSQGPSGTGNCVCQPGFAGNLCQNCAENHGGKNCVQCPANCGNGTCSTGIAGTGQCVCNPGWAGADCSTCASGYYSSECKQCPTCNGHGTCNQGLNGDGLCTCATGWTGDNCESCASGFVASGANCAPCDPTCATCSGTGSNQCQTCASGLLYNSGSCVANCPPGKYRSGNQCLACDPSCKTCFGGGPNQCQTCEPPKLLENGVCVSTCASSNFVQGTSCSPCSQSCATCSGTASNCTSCSGSGNLYNGQCVNSCPTDHYASNNECRPCDSTCATCSGPGPSSCATCPPGKVFLSGQCISACPAGYYEESGICKACRHPCDECTETATKCTKCKTGYLYSEVFNTCTENCTSSQYPIDETECGVCDGSCLSCSGPSDSECTSCDEGLVLQNGVCKESCDPGFFLTGTDCLPCSSSCATCVDTSSKCTSCTGNLALSDNTCVNNCPPGTWKNGNNCDSCVGCLTCNGGTSNNCLSCEEAEALQGTTCQPDCDDKHFEQDNVCYPCHQTCQSCSGTNSSSCLTCIGGLVLDGTQCLNQCPPGKFDNAGVCETCDENCATCTGSATTCQTCPEDGVPYLQGTTCVGECEPDQFISSGRCTDCPSSCATCSGSSPQDCLSCTGSLYLREDGTCTPTCPSSQYANGATNTCDDCDDSCLTCSGPDQDDCLSCAETVLDESTCRPECPPGKYRNPATNTCGECFFTCATCSSGQSNDCDTCEDPRSLHQGTCIENCPAGFFSKDNRCEECDDNCATCVTSATTCVSCPEDTYMLNGQCYSPCPEGYYGADSMECVECFPTRECQNEGSSVCETGLCNCTGTGYGGPFCDCSEAPCLDNCNGVGLCTCGVCQCDPQINWGERCECQQCPGTLPCSEKGTCNCDGTCTCEDGFVGSDCSVACIYDECGVCFGNGNTCSGCDGVPNSGKTFDACGQCGGDNSTCAGCDGVPHSKARYDRCGVCNGTGSTCIEDLMCGERTSCATCTITFGQQEIRLCSWCNTTGTCIAVDKEPTCPEVIADCSPEEPTPASTDDLQNNGKGTSTGAIVGAVLGVVVAAAVIAALIYLAKMGKGPLYFESENFDDGAAAYNNPLYEEYSPQQENPLYVPPK